MKDLTQFMSEGMNNPKHYDIWNTKRSLLIGFGYNTEIKHNELNIDLQVHLQIKDNTNSRTKGLDGWSYDFDLTALVPFETSQILNMNICKKGVLVDLDETGGGFPGELRDVLDDLDKYTEPGIRSQISYQITDRISRICSEHDIFLDERVAKDIRKQMDVLLAVK